MSVRALALCALAILSLGQPATAEIFWSTFDGTYIGYIDTATGVTTIVGPSGQGSTYGLAEDPTTGVLYASFGSSIGTVDKATGAVTVIGDTTHAIYGIDFDPSGQMWALAGGGTAIYRVDKATGVATLVGDTPNADWMDISFDGPVLYGVGGEAMNGNPGVTLYIINTTSGVGTKVADVTGDIIDVMGIGFAGDGTLYVTGYWDGEFGTMNPATGVTLMISTTPENPHSGEIGAAAMVPVPTLSPFGEIALAGLLLLAAWAWLRRRPTGEIA